MEENEYFEEQSNAEPIFKIIIAECVLVALILAFILCTKCFFKPTYRKIQRFYENEFCGEITVEDFLNEI